MLPEITLKLVLGVLLGVISTCGLIANTLVVVPVYQLAFVSKKSPIYIIALVNIFADVFTLSLTTFYLVPKILFSAYVRNSFTNIPVPLIFGSCFMFCWYLGSITQIIMAINRVVVICLKYDDFFTRIRLIFIFSLVLPICVILMYLAQYGFQCCPLVYDSQILSIRYLKNDGDVNLSNNFIDVPLNFTCSVVALVCYSMILANIWKARSQVESLGGVGNVSNLREYVYAFQFCLISIVYTISWLLFRIFPIILGPRYVELYSMVMVTVSLNNLSNAVVYIFFNKEVARCIRNSRFLLCPRSNEVENGISIKVVS